MERTATRPAAPAHDLPWSREAPDGPWDAIVIGSGMGGMSAAALLSRLGRRVLVLEQHYVPGGFTHTFRRRGYVWDVGVHAVGEVTRKSFPGRLLADLTGGRLEWSSLGPVYDAFDFPGGLSLEFPDSPDAFRANLLAAFPGEQRAIDAYLAQVRAVARGMRGYYLSRLAPAPLDRLAGALLARPVRRALKTTTQQVVSRLTPDPRLRTVLTAQWGYYGATPARSAFAIQALVTKHFLWGGYYPVGGSAAIARELLRTVADAGGWTRIRADVEELRVERGRVTGVRLTGGEELRAPIVISATGALETTRRLLPPELRGARWLRPLSGLEPAPAHVCLYLGLKGDPRPAGASGANRWFWSTWDAERDVWDLSDPDDLPPAPVLYVSFPSLKDPTHDAPERHTAEVVTFVPWDAFARWEERRWRRRGADYEALKERLQESLLAQLLERMPGLAPLVDHVELSTPLSTDHFCRPVRGSIYGIAPTPARFAARALRPRTPIRGLYLAGSDVASVGVVGAQMGGVLAATAAAPRAAARRLREMV